MGEGASLDESARLKTSSECPDGSVSTTDDSSLGSSTPGKSFSSKLASDTSGIAFLEPSDDSGLSWDLESGF